MIRMKLGGDYYSDLAYELDDDHITHCVDSIRQSLMYVLFIPLQLYLVLLRTLFTVKVLCRHFYECLAVER